jgi:hypothetical protein
MPDLDAPMAFVDLGSVGGLARRRIGEVAGDLPAQGRLMGLDREQLPPRLAGLQAMASMLTKRPGALEAEPSSESVRRHYEGLQSHLSKRRRKGERIVVAVLPVPGEPVAAVEAIDNSSALARRRSPWRDQHI